MRWGIPDRADTESSLTVYANPGSALLQVGRDHPLLLTRVRATRTLA
jgi:hypothetical protein